MSYDLNIGQEEANFTSNINLLLSELDGSFLRDLNGLTGKQAANKISVWIRIIMENPSYYKRKCSTEWGTFEQCLVVLFELLDLSIYNPKNTWHVTY